MTLLHMRRLHEPHPAPILGLCGQASIYMKRIRFIYTDLGETMGIVKIGEELHEVIRRASTVMCRSINAQAEFWMKIGMIAEANPGLTYTEIVRMQLEAAQAGPADTAVA